VIMIVEMGIRPVAADLVGGRLCLDFVNTVHNYGSGTLRDDISSYSDLVAWSRRADLLDEAEGRLVGREALQRPAEARAAITRMKEFREGLYSLFVAIVEDRPPSRNDLAILNAALSEALVQSQVVRRADGFVWSWRREDRMLDRVLWPIARSAADLLTSKDVSRLRQCEGDDCTWLFLDTSKNRSRRWCEMRVCGNRVKARRHYLRNRSKRARRRK
jgi:predicted RNA-binding Zn ribbon-like protein